MFKVKVFMKEGGDYSYMCAEHQVPTSRCLDKEVFLAIPSSNKVVTLVRIDDISIITQTLLNDEVPECKD